MLKHTKFPTGKIILLVFALTLFSNFLAIAVEAKPMLVLVKFSAYNQALQISKSDLKKASLDIILKNLEKSNLVKQIDTQSQEGEYGFIKVYVNIRSKHRAYITATLRADSPGVPETKIKARAAFKSPLSSDVANGLIAASNELSEKLSKRISSSFKPEAISTYYRFSVSGTRNLVSEEDIENTGLNAVLRELNSSGRLELKRGSPRRIDKKTMARMGIEFEPLGRKTRVLITGNFPNGKKLRVLIREKFDSLDNDTILETYRKMGQKAGQEALKKLGFPKVGTTDYHESQAEKLYKEATELKKNEEFAKARIWFKKVSKIPAVKGRKWVEKSRQELSWALDLTEAQTIMGYVNVLEDKTTEQKKLQQLCQQMLESKSEDKGFTRDRKKICDFAFKERNDRIRQKKSIQINIEVKQQIAKLSKTYQESVSYPMAPLFNDDGFQNRNRYKLSKGIPEPSGDRIAFIASRNWESEIVIWNPKKEGLFNSIKNSQKFFNLTKTLAGSETYARLKWSPTGDLILAPLKKGLFIFSTKDTKERVQLTKKRNLSEFAWSPSGDRVAFFDHKKLWVVRSDGTNAKVIAETTKNGSKDIVWWKDSGNEYIAFISGWKLHEKNVHLVPVNGGKVEQLTNEGSYAYLRLAPNKKDLLVDYSGGSPTATETRKIAPESKMKAVGIGKSQPGKNMLQGTVQVLHAHSNKLTHDGKSITADEVGKWLFRSRVDHYWNKMAETTSKVALENSEKPTKSGSEKFIRVRAKDYKTDSVTKMAKALVKPRKAPYQIRLGPITVEVLGVQVESHKGGSVSLNLHIRYLDHIGVAYLRNSDGAFTGISIQELYKENKEYEKSDVMGHYREYSIVVPEVRVDPKSGTWKSLDLELWRYDEVQGRRVAKENE